MIPQPRAGRPGQAVDERVSDNLAGKFIDSARLAQKVGYFVMEQQQVQGCQTDVVGFGAAAGAQIVLSTSGEMNHVVGSPGDDTGLDESLTSLFPKTYKRVGENRHA